MTVVGEVYRGCHLCGVDPVQRAGRITIPIHAELSSASSAVLQSLLAYDSIAGPSFFNISPSKRPVTLIHKKNLKIGGRVGEFVTAVHG